MHSQKEHYKIWKIFAAEMDFFDFDTNGPKTEKTYTYFTNLVKSHVEKAIHGKSKYIMNMNGKDRELPDNWWEVAIGIHNGQKIIPNEVHVIDDDSSVDSAPEEQEEESPAHILGRIADTTIDNAYAALLPVYTALRENYDSRFKLFSWIFDHARYTAERDSMKALSGMIQALTGESKEELDRRYREFKREVQLNPEQKKKLDEKVKIDKLKISDPEKAEKLIAKRKMLDEQKKLAEKNKVDEYRGEINYGDYPAGVDNEDDGSEIDEEENDKNKENSLNENREQLKDSQLAQDVSDGANENDVSRVIDDSSELNRSNISRGSGY